MSEVNESPLPLSIPAGDGYVLKGFAWRHAGGERRPVVVVNPATSVRCRYYSRFAAFLHGHGFDAVTYDYRGIGESRPASLRGFKASWLDWGRLDFEAVLGHVAREFPDQPIQVAAHSVGGFLIGLAPSSHLVDRVFTMGAQFAYWRDYCPARRLPMLLKWHGVMPALAAAFGYFPGSRLGWLEDTPRGVVQDWTARHPRFEDAYRRGPRALPEAERRALAEGFAALRGPTLALSISDDPFGTVPAIRRLLSYYRHSPATHLHLAPGDIGMDAIGHFAFFHSRFQDSLWPIALAWLQSGRLPEGVPGRVLAPEEGDQAPVLPASARIQRTTS
jgi:predicted alpha/beta hydrolase